MANYGDNFREGSKYENNEESLFEVQFLDYGTQGTDDEWTPVNTSPNATQGSAIESNFGPGDCGGWADLSASPWLYNLFKAERTTSGSLDPRLYWTIGTYEPEWEGFEYGNKIYNIKQTDEWTNANIPVVTNNNYGGLPVAKNTNLRTGIYDKVVTGLHCGINLRMMRYSDVLLRAAECENEVNGPTQQAIDWINQVRECSRLQSMPLSTSGQGRLMRLVQSTLHRRIQLMNRIATRARSTVGFLVMNFSPSIRVLLTITPIFRVIQLTTALATKTSSMVQFTL